MSATTEHARALAQLSGDYSRTLSQIYQQQGDIAARDIQARGQIWGNAVSQLGQIGAQTFQAATAARQEDQIRAILQKYPDDITKAIPEINKINPELGHKIAKQTHEEKLWAHDLKKIGWEAEGQKYLALLAKVNQVNDDAGMARLRYAAQQLGIETGTYPTQFDPAWKAKTIQSLKEAYQAHQGSFPAAPQPVKIETTEGGQNVSKFVTPVPGTSYPSQVPAAPQAQPGTPAHETTVRQQELLRQQGGAPAAAPAPVPAPTTPPPSLTVDQVERRAPVPAAAPAPAAGAAPNYGNRYGTTTPKGLGFLGPLRRPDGKVSSEISVGVELDGNEVEIPAIVPTLTRSELQQLLIMKEGDQVPKSVLDKAVAHAKQRMAQGKDPFAGPGEQQVKYPDLVAPQEAGPLSENQAWLKAYEEQRAATKKDEADKHSPAYIEWQDYRNNGGTLDFDAYMNRDANRKAVQIRVTGEGDQEDIEEAVDCMIRGDCPPMLPGRASKAYTGMMAVASRKGFNLAGAATDWMATQKHIQTMNGAQQLRLNQAINALPEMLDNVEALAKQWKAGSFPLLNKANLALAKGGAFGAKAASIANQLDAQIADVTADLGNVYMGGNSPTDHALQLAEKSLKSDWSESVMLDMVALAKKNVQIRRNSINNTGVQGASADNPYVPQPQPQPQPPPPPPPVVASGVRKGYQRVTGPNGETGQVPIGAPLPAGWKVVP